MSSLTANADLYPFDLFVTVLPNATPPQFANINLGAFASTKDGRCFRFAQVGAVSLVAGQLQQSAAIIANHQSLVPTVVQAIGSNVITVTLGATAATANQYADGYVITQTGTGLGQTLQIKSHPAANASAVLTLTLSDVIQTATDLTTTVSLIPNPYMNIIVAPTTATNAPVGVALYNSPATAFTWIQTHGTVATLASATIAAGASVSRSAATAGAVITSVAGAAIVGNVVQAGASAAYNGVFLVID